MRGSVSALLDRLYFNVTMEDRPRTTSLSKHTSLTRTRTHTYTHTRGDGCRERMEEMEAATRKQLEAEEALAQVKRHYHHLSARFDQAKGSLSYRV